MSISLNSIDIVVDIMSPLLLRGAPDYSTDAVSEFHAEEHRQLYM